VNKQLQWPQHLQRCPLLRTSHRVDVLENEVNPVPPNLEGKGRYRL
jgi:hypothetical protein